MFARIARTCLGLALAAGCGGTTALDNGADDGGSCQAKPAAEAGNCYSIYEITGDPSACGLPASGAAPLAVCQRVCGASVRSCGRSGARQVRCEVCQ